MSKGNTKGKKTVSPEREREIKDIKSKEKKAVKRIVIIVAIVSIVVLTAWSVSEFLGKNETQYEFVVHQKEEIYPTINPFPADFDKDLSDYKPLIMYKYKDRGLTASLNDIPESDQNEGQRFFAKYFDIVINGDYKNYASLFTESYKKTPNGFEKDFTRQFPPQELFDIRVEEILPETVESDTKYTYEGKNCSFSCYLVSYKINKNDGYFRRDLYSREVERPLVFELVTFDKGTSKEVTYIRNMYTESSIEKPS